MNRYGGKRKMDWERDLGEESGGILFVGVGGIARTLFERLFKFPDPFPERTADFRQAFGAKKKQDHKQDDDDFKRAGHTH